MATSSPVPPGARLRRRISSCRRGSEAKCSSLASVVVGLRRASFRSPWPASRGPDRNRGPAPRRRCAVRPRRDRDSGRAPRAPSRCRRLRRGRTAAPRRVRQAGGIGPCCRRPLPRRSRVRPRSEMVASRSEKNALAMWISRVRVMSNPTSDLWRSSHIKRIERIRIPIECRVATGAPAAIEPIGPAYWSPVEPAMSPSLAPTLRCLLRATNSVGVLPVTCRKACEKAGTLA